MNCQTLRWNRSLLELKTCLTPISLLLFHWFHCNIDLNSYESWSYSSNKNLVGKKYQLIDLNKKTKHRASNKLFTCTNQWGAYSDEHLIIDNFWCCFSIHCYYIYCFM